MNKQQLTFSILQKMGYSPELDDEGDIRFRYQMKSFYAIVSNDEDSFVTITLPQFYEIEEGEDMLVLAVCNKLTRDFKLTKVFIDQTLKSVSATCEFYYINEESLELNIRQSLMVLGIIRSAFKNKKNELSK